MKVKRAPIDDLVHQHLAVTVKTAAAGDEAGGRYVDVVASTETEDGDGQVLIQDWDLTAYAKNPVVLYGHNAPSRMSLMPGYGNDVDAEDTLPIGFATNVRVEGKQLLARLNFVDANANPLAEKVYQGMKQGSLRAVSVGFIQTPATNAVVETHDGRDVIRISGLQLREISVVPMGSNPETVAEERAKSLVAAKALIKSPAKVADERNRDMAFPVMLLALLGLAEGANDAEVTKAIQAKTSIETELIAVTGAKSAAAALGVVTAWKSAAEHGAKAMSKLAELEGKSLTDEATRILDEGAKAGKITKAVRDSLEKRPVKSADDLEYLKGLVGALPVVAKIDGKGHEEPKPKDTAGGFALTEEDEIVRKSLNLSVEEFTKALKTRKAFPRVARNQEA